MNGEMSLSDIQAAKINLVVAKEAHDQVAKRLADILDTKKNYEQKAFTLFSGYMTAALAVFGVAGTIYKDHGFTVLSISFGASGIVLLVGAVLFMLALHDSPYGAPGSSPNMWLRKGVIDGEDSALQTMLAFITHHHGERIKQSIESNLHKAKLVRRGIYAGIASPIVLAVSALVLKAFS